MPKVPHRSAIARARWCLARHTAVYLRRQVLAGEASMEGGTSPREKLAPAPSAVAVEFNRALRWRWCMTRRHRRTRWKLAA
jgi:hypothetical protein